MDPFEYPLEPPRTGSLMDNTPEEEAAMSAMVRLVDEKVLSLRISQDKQRVEFYCGRIVLPLCKVPVRSS